MNRPSEVPPAVDSLGLDLQFLLHGAGSGLRQSPGDGQERQTGYEPVERIVDAMLLQHAFDRRLQRIDRLFGRKP